MRIKTYFPTGAQCWLPLHLAAGPMGQLQSRTVLLQAPGSPCLSVDMMWEVSSAQTGMFQLVKERVKDAETSILSGSGLTTTTTTRYLYMVLTKN